MVCVNKKNGGYNETHIFWTSSFSDKSNDVMQKNNYFNELQKKRNLILLLNGNKFIILEPPVAAHRGHPQGSLLPNWPPRRPKAPSPGPAGAASGGQNHWLFFNIAHAAKKETEAQGPSPAPFERAALGDVVMACAPGVDGAGMGGKKEFLHLGHIMLIGGESWPVMVSPHIYD